MRASGLASDPASQEAATLLLRPACVRIPPTDEPVPGQRQIGLFLLDDDEAARHGLRRLPESDPGRKVIGETGPPRHIRAGPAQADGNRRAARPEGLLSCGFARFRAIGDVVFYRRAQGEGDPGWGRCWRSSSLTLITGAGSVRL